MDTNGNYVVNNHKSKDDILISVFLSDNHLQNVKTLQSIYKQKFGNIYLCLINNRLLDFQCERFIYNLNVNKSDSVKQIYMYENECREYAFESVLAMLYKFNVEYLYIMCAGERFESEVAVKNALDALNKSEYSTINCFPYCQSNKLIYLNINPDNNLISWVNVKECMFLYDASIIRKMNDNNSKEYRFAQNVIPKLLTEGATLKIHSQKLCILDEDARDFEI